LGLELLLAVVAAGMINKMVTVVLLAVVAVFQMCVLLLVVMQLHQDKGILEVAMGVNIHTQIRVVAEEALVQQVVIALQILQVVMVVQELIQV
jgi:hypothetical protein